MKYPPNYKSTSSKEVLSQGPRDMPDRGGKKAPDAQVTSSRVTLSRKENFPAYMGAHPGMGDVQCSSTKQTLSRQTAAPYDNLNPTVPQAPFKKRK